VAAPLLQRYEIKYVISERLVASIRDFMAPYVRLDPFSQRSSTGKYPISSLYLDTPDHRLASETRDGVKTRYKMRIRAYDDTAETPVFCEVKHRDGDVVRKTRVGIPRDSLSRLREGGSIGDAMPEKDRWSLADFQKRVVQGRFSPAMIVRYNREAFESSHGAPVRITFDRSLRRLHAVGWEIPVKDVAWTPVRWHPDPAALVLEVKFTGNAPRWVRQMIRHLEIRQRGHGKYVTTIEHDGPTTPRAGSDERMGSF